MLSQQPRVIWFTGLSGAGKSTNAEALTKHLRKQGFLVRPLDGDFTRKGISKDLGFSDRDRWENIRRVAEISRLFLDSGFICVNAYISPTRAIREMAYSITGRDRVIEVYVKSDIQTCESRDIKGLYKKARSGLIQDFTGISSPFEEPENPDLILNTNKLSPGESLQLCLDYILPIIQKA